MEQTTEISTVSQFMALKQKIKTKKAKIGIFGLGYVGLPHAIYYGKKGFPVVGIDTNTDKVLSLKNGLSYIDDVNDEAVRNFLRDNAVTDSYNDLSELDVLIVDVPTPLDSQGKPDTTCLSVVAEAILEQVRPGQLIILESTSYPTTTREFFIDPLFRRGYTIGEDVFVAFSPERIDPGNREYSIDNTPKLVGGATPACTKLAAGVIGEMAVELSSPEAAEMSKLYENTFRFVNISLANELTRACDQLSIDANEVLDAAATKPFGFMKFHPTIKIGGHCIGVDPYYLKWFMEKTGHETPILNAASEVDQSMLVYGVTKILKRLSDQRISSYEAKIAVYGVTYKKNVSDLRLSAAPELTSQLEGYGVEITLVDPLVNSIRIEEVDRPVIHPNHVQVSDFDLILLLVDHDYFDYEQIKADAKILMDFKGTNKK